MTIRACKNVEGEMDEIKTEIDEAGPLFILINLPRPRARCFPEVE